jgi:outer membrane immunogenic protein
MRVFVVIGGLLAATCLAWAADLPSAPMPQPVYTPPPPPVVYNWTGFYFGGNVGYGWATSSGTSTINVPAGFGVVVGVNATATTSGNTNGAIAGGQVGYNYQIGALVLGAEADMQWSGQSTTQTASCGVGCTLTGTSGIDWFATVRARIGGAFDRLLIYGTGGLAIIDATDKLSASGFGATINLVSLSDTAIGFTAGAGLEYAITNNILAKAEFLYMQADASASGNIGLIGGTASEKATVKDSIVRLGLNYKF